MQLNDQAQPSNNPTQQQVDIHNCPLPIRIKHPSWSVRKGTYQQILYYLKNISSPNQQILISGSVYTIETLLPYFQNLVQEKHASVLLKGLQCVQQILILQKKYSSKHCIKTLVDKGIEYFPLLSQQKKAILQKFLDILQLSKIESAFLKNKLNLPHQKSVMYVIEVIGVLNMTSLKTSLLNLSKKHQKKCVRQLAAEIAQQLEPSANQLNERQEASFQKQKGKISSKSNAGENTSKSQSSKLTIQKLPHYEQLPSKKQQEYSNQLVQKIDFIIDEYSMSQIPSFSHVLRLMIDDNNHIVNVNAIKCMIKIFLSERGDSMNKNSLIPQSFPLLFIFNKFKSHKTHPINSLLLSLTEAILQSSPNRVNDLLLAISQGLTSAGSKANVKFGCALTFLRVISLVHQNEDLYACTTNENIENENENLEEKFNLFTRIKFGKNQLKMIQKIMSNLQKDKKYETQIYLIKYAIGLDTNNFADQGSMKQVPVSSKSSTFRQSESSKTINKNQETLKMKKSQVSLQTNKKAQNTKIKVQMSEKSFGATKTLKGSKSSQKFLEINLQDTLKSIMKCLNEGNRRASASNMKTVKGLLERSREQFYSCVREKRYEMFYLCELLEGFIESYEPSEETIEYVSEYLVSLLKIISLLKPLSVHSEEISRNNVCQLLLVALCKLAISEEIQEVLQNLNQSYGFELIFESLQNLFVHNKSNKIKKKNRKYLLQWLESNTPALFLNGDYDKLIESITNDKKEDKPKKAIKLVQDIDNNINQQQIENKYNNNLQRSNVQKERRKSAIKQPKLKQTSLHLNQKNPLTSSQIHNYQTVQSRSNMQLKSSRKRQNVNNFFELQNINLSKIENNNAESNYYDEEYMEKSSFHQNLEQQLKQIKTYRTSYDYEDQENFVQQRKVDQNNVSREYLKNLKVNQNNVSREYLKNLKIDNFKKKQNNNNYDNQHSNNNRILESALKQKMLQTSPYGKRQQQQQQQYQQAYKFEDSQQEQQQGGSTFNREQQTYKKGKQLRQRQGQRQGQRQRQRQRQRQGQIQIQRQTCNKGGFQNQRDVLDTSEQKEYVKKFEEVERRRVERERERRQFMDRMKGEFKPIMRKQHQHQHEDEDDEDKNENYQQIADDDHNNHPQEDYDHNNHPQEEVQQNQQYRSINQQHLQQQQQYTDSKESSHQEQHQPQQQSQAQNDHNRNQSHKGQPINYPLLSKNEPIDPPSESYNIKSTEQQHSPYFNNQSQPQNIQENQQLQLQVKATNKIQSSTPDSSFLSTNSTGEFKYKLLNHQKVTYMLKSTTNPYPHLRTLVLIPFKSSPKKHQFLQQLIHFFTNQVQFKIPQPYTALTLLTILMFSQIKEDKSLIQPLQSLYELVAKQSTTNEFLRTIISLFHTVIEETLLGNRRFLITILLKSMIRMLPFIEDGVSLLRDIQQFYQIGEMVYFEMFEQEYRQIRGCLEQQGVHMIVQKGLEEEGENLRAIVEGWLGTGWKNRVLEVMEEFQNEHEDVHDQQDQEHYQSHQHRNQHQGQEQQEQYSHKQNYQSII